jgi:HK97 family phage prohead protease
MRTVDDVLVLGDLPPFGARYTLEVHGYADTWDDVGTKKIPTRRGAFAATLAHPRTNRVPIWLDHDPRRVVGMAIGLSEDYRGVFCHARIAPAYAHETLQRFFAGELGGLSIGVTYRVNDERCVWLREVSLVRTPANPNARIHTIVIGTAARREPSPQAWRPLPDDERVEETITRDCRACGAAFVIDGGEQRWMRVRGLVLPTHCPACRAYRRAEVRRPGPTETA